MTQSSMYNSFIGGELSPSLFAHTDLDKFRNGATTMRNCFVDYRGGALSRAGFAYVGKSLQDPSGQPPRLIPFEFNITQEYALEFGQQTVAGTVTGAANNGAGLIRLALKSTRGIWSGSTMVVSGVAGATEANGTWPVTVIDATHVDLVGSAFSSAYTSGGTASDVSGYMRVVFQGGYITEATKNVTGVDNANPSVLTIVAHGYQPGDWIALEDIGGAADLNGLSWIVATAPSADTLTLTDLFGNPFVNDQAYTTGGTAARIYTTPSPYLTPDLQWLKFTQSADTISFGCVNQQTLTEYPPYDLVRNGATNWVFNQVTFAAGIAAPGSLAVTALSSTTTSTYYSYVATAVSSATGEESVASNIATVKNNDISINAGSNALIWQPVAGAASYNLYAATAVYSATIPVGVPYGYIGTSLGTNFVDTNITADFAQVPPTHQNPFARGKITNVVIAAPGSGYSQSTVTYSVTSATGSGFDGVPVISGGALVSFYIQDAGENYLPGDTITISTGGTGATATLQIGAETGTYPGCTAYYQQRRVYGYTIDSPNTYFMSQPGAYTNMDSSIPVTDSDAIIGAPWAQQINGIQFMVPMTGGLMILTGLGAWYLNGGSQAAITPANQDALAQAYNGCHSLVQPIVVNYDILYVQSKGSIIRDLSYNFFVNIWTGADKTVLASHLFNYHQIIHWAYAEEPYKIVWAVRDDGTMLSYTYLKEQNVSAFGRHDTNGFFFDVISITELPVDALYAVVKRYIIGQSQWAYYIERMDNRNWTNAENCFCVDGGLSLPLSYPSGTLTAPSATGTSNITSVNVATSGTGYTNPTAIAVDSSGKGTGATFNVGLCQPGWSLTASAYTGEFYDPSDQISNRICGISFSADGSKMYVGDRSLQFSTTICTIYEYNLSVPFNIGTAVYSGKSYLFLDPGFEAPYRQQADSFYFETDGTKLYISSSSTAPTGYLLQFSLLIPWDITTAIPDWTYSLGVLSGGAIYYNSLTEGPYGGVYPKSQGFCFSPNGDILYIGFANSRLFFQFSLSTSWDISSATFVGYYDTVAGSSGYYPQNFFTRPDGSEFFAIDFNYPGSLNNFIMDDFNNISTSSLTATYAFGSPIVAAYNFFIIPSGEYYYVSDATTNIIYQFSAGSNACTIGEVVSITPTAGGQGYVPGQTSIVISDTTGTGAVASPVITNNVPFTASADVFNSGMVGDVIRYGNNNAAVSPSNLQTINGYGKAIITQYVSPTEVIANIVSPITAVIPNDPTKTPVPAIAGQWSLGAPTKTVSGLNHLEGMTVAVTGDGGYVGTQIVTDGTVTLPVACSAITVGLPYLPQLQTMYLDVPEPGGGTVMGKRKNIQNISLRVVNSRGISCGVNQFDSSQTPNGANVPWTDMEEIKEMTANVPLGQPMPLFSQDFWINLPQPDADSSVYGQVAFQQNYPFPMSISGAALYYEIGDSSG